MNLGDCLSNTHSLIVMWWFIVRYPSLHIIVICGEFSLSLLTHWGRVTHICVINLTIIGSDSGFFAWTPPSHYLNRCWNIVNWTFRNKIQWKLNQNSYIFIKENSFKDVICEMACILSRMWAENRDPYYNWCMCSYTWYWSLVKKIKISLSTHGNNDPDQVLISHLSQQLSCLDFWPVQNWDWLHH